MYWQEQLERQLESLGAPVGDASLCQAKAFESIDACPSHLNDGAHGQVSSKLEGGDSSGQVSSKLEGGDSSGKAETSKLAHDDSARLCCSIPGGQHYEILR